MIRAKMAVIGKASSGMITSRPPSSPMTTIISKEKGRSIRLVRVTAVRNSRSPWKSWMLCAKPPMVAGRADIDMPVMRSNRVADEHHVGLLAGYIQQVGAQHAQQQLEGGADEQPDGQHPERGGGLIGHHPVVGLHHEQRHHQAEQVDQQAGQHRIGVQPARQLEGVAEPGLDPGHQRRAGLFEFMLWLGEEGLAAVLDIEVLAVDPLFTAIGLARQDQQLVLRADLAQHGAAAVLEQEQHGQVERRDGFQRATQDATLQAGPGSGAWQQVCTQSLLGQGQPGRQAGAAGGAVVQVAKNEQSVQQRVVVTLPLVIGRSPFHGGQGSLLLRVARRGRATSSPVLPHFRQAGLALHFGEGYSFGRYYDVLFPQQLAHGGDDAIHGELFGVAHLGVAAVGGEEFVLAVQQVQQGALAEAELLLVASQRAV